MWAMADAYGGVDSGGLLLKWYHQNSAIITRAGERPLDFTAYWGAKSPWRFIQLCRGGLTSN